VYKVNKQVNDNILYMMDNEVRDPSVQLYLFLDKWRWRMIIFLCVFNIGREREKERHTFLSIFHRTRKKNLSPSLFLLLDRFFLACFLYERKEKIRREIFAFSLSLSLSIGRSVVCSNELRDSYILYVLRPNKWRNPRPMSTQKEC
jgi:hypothetical protein